MESVNSNYKTTFYICFLIILVTLYRNSWLPGGFQVQGKEIYLFFFLTLFVLLINLDFKSLYVFAHTGVLFRDNKYIISLFIVFLISVFFHNTQEIASIFNVVYILTYVCYVYLFFFKLPEILLSRNDLFKKYLVFTSYMGIILAYLGMIIMLIGLSPIKIYSFTTHSIIVHPNYVTFFYTISIVTTLYYYIEYRSAFSLFAKYFVIISFIILLLAQLFTFGRGGYIGTVVGVGVLLTFYFRKRVVVIFPVFMAILVLIIPSFFKVKGTGSFISRFFLLIPAYHMIVANKTNLLWGYGVYNNMKVFVKYMNEYNLNYPTITDPHNSVLRLIMMFGLLFSLLLIIYVFILIIRALACSRSSKNSDDKFLYGYLLAMVLALLSMGLFDSGLTSTVYFYIQFLLTSLGLIYHKTKPKGHYQS